MVKQLINFFFIVWWLENYGYLCFLFLGLRGLFQICWLVCLLVGRGDFVHRGRIWKVVSLCVYGGSGMLTFLRMEKIFTGLKLFLTSLVDWIGHNYLFFFYLFIFFLDLNFRIQILGFVLFLFFLPLPFVFPMH